MTEEDGEQRRTYLMEGQIKDDAGERKSVLSLVFLFRLYLLSQTKDDIR